MVACKRTKIVANEQDRLRSWERKEIPFYTNSHFTPTRGEAVDLERCFVWFMTRSLHICWSSACVGSSLPSQEIVSRPPRDLAAPRSALLRLFHRLFLAETYCCSFDSFLMNALIFNDTPSVILCTKRDRSSIESMNKLIYSYFEYIRGRCTLIKIDLRIYHSRIPYASRHFKMLI